MIARKNATSSSAVRRTSKSNKGVTAPEASLLPKAMKVLGMTVDEFGKRSKVAVRFKNGGKCNVASLEVSDLASGKTDALAKVLAENGYFEQAEAANVKRIAKALLPAAEQCQTIVLHSNGYHEVLFDGQTYKALVWGKTVYWLGPVPDVRVQVVQVKKMVPPSCTLDQWKTSVGFPLTGNPIPIVVHCHALASLVRRLLNQPHTGLSLVGLSGDGKSTTQKSAQSQAEPISDVLPMSGTKLGISKRILDRPDLPVFFMDSKQMDSVKEYFDLVFDVAEGAARLRANDSPDQANSRRLAGTLILSNERTAQEMTIGTNVRIDEGLYARMFELRCNGPHGIFHDLHGCEDGAAFAKKLNAKCLKYYGAVWPEWNRVWAYNYEAIVSGYRNELADVTAKLVHIAGDKALQRVNNRITDALAFSAWAGCVASTYEVFPISRDEIIESFGFVLKEHFAKQSPATTPMGEQIVEAVRGCLDRNTGRFPRLDAFHDEKGISPMGYRINHKKYGELFLFLCDVFKELFEAKFGGAVFATLQQAGFLVSSKGRGNQYQKRIPGDCKQKSFVAIRASIRFDEN